MEVGRGDDEDAGVGDAAPDGIHGLHLHLDAVQRVHEALEAESAMRRDDGPAHGALVVGGLNHVGHEALHADAVEDIAERFEIGALVLEAKLLRQLKACRAAGTSGRPRRQPVHDALTGPCRGIVAVTSPTRPGGSTSMATVWTTPPGSGHRGPLMAAMASRSPQQRICGDRADHANQPDVRFVRLRANACCQSRVHAAGGGSRGIRTACWGRPLCVTGARARPCSQADWRAVRQQTCRRTREYSAACWAFAPQQRLAALAAARTRMCRRRRRLLTFWNALRRSALRVAAERGRRCVFAQHSAMPPVDALF